MIALGALCDVSYGSKLDLNKRPLLPRADGGVNFVGRSSEGNGVTATIAPIDGLPPLEAGLITVALGGSKVLSAFVQDEPFYTAQNVAVLKPRQTMSPREKIFLCLCIRHNRPRYSAFGREANRTIRHILVPRPEDFPSFVSTATVTTIDGRDAPALRFTTAVSNPLLGGMTLVPLQGLFDIRAGHSLELNHMRRAEAPEGVNFVGRSMINNGVTGRVQIPEGVAPGKPGELSVALGGNVLATFVQPEPFVCGFHVAILVAKDTSMSLVEKLWWCTCIYANRYRFSYGRQANRTLAEIPIPMPVAGRAGIERFMKSLPFSSQAA